MDARTKRIFKFVFLTLIVDLLAFTLILPLLPKILDYYAINDKSGFFRTFENNVQVIQNLLNVPESHNQVLLAGILGSWFSMLQFISSPFLGALSDRFGRKPILILALFGSSLSYLVWFLASKSFGLFILSRTIGGFCKANVGLSLAIISDVSDVDSRGKGMAIIGSSFSLAFIFGPLLGAYLSTLARGNQLEDQLIMIPSSIALVLSLIDLAIVILFLEETNLFSVMKNSSKKLKTDSQELNQSAISKSFHYINPKSLFSFNLVMKKTKKEASILQRSGLIYFYYLLFYSGLEYTLTFLTHLRFGFTSMEQGKLYLFSGFLMAIIQAGYIRRMKGGKEALMASIGLITIVPSFILMGLSNSVTQIYLALSLYSISSALVVPCITTIVSTHGCPESRGLVMGTLRSIGSLARALGPGIASLLFWTFGSTLCYLAGALALLLPIYLMRDLHSVLKKEKQSFYGTKDKKYADSIELAKAN